MINRRRFLTISAVSAAGLLAGRQDNRVEWRGVALGADVSITLYGQSKPQAERALKAAHETIARMEKLFSIYDPESEISRLNTDQSRQLPSDFMDLVHIADRAHLQTNGLFDPTVQPVFLALNQDNEADYARVGWKHVYVGVKDIQFQRSGMALTFNGIAQGFATDRVRDTLLDYGFEQAIINIGEFRMGSKPMKIGISGAEGTILAVETVINAAIATSNAGGYRFPNGASHIINPLERRNPSWASATVIADQAAIADALSTALILAEGTDLAKRLVTSGMAKRVLLEDYSGRTTWIDLT